MRFLEILKISGKRAEIAQKFRIPEQSRNFRNYGKFREWMGRLNILYILHCWQINICFPNININ